MSSRISNSRKVPGLKICELGGKYRAQTIEWLNFKYPERAVVLDYSGHKSCISQDARLYFARLVSQDFSCKTCKTKIYLSTLFFWLKLEVFSQKIKLGLTKKFFILSFVTFIQKNTLF